VTTPTIEFRNPPREPSTRGRQASESDVAVAAAARENPGVWVVLPLGTRKASPLATNVKAGSLKTFAPKGSFEATCQDGEVFIRFRSESE